MAKQRRDNETEMAILTAARKVFTHKGYSAARMEDIAREAGINRALLHYYFRSKDRMFDLVFEQRIREFFVGLAQIMSRPLPLFDKIRAIVEHDINMILVQPDLPIFIMQELTQSPDRLIAVAKNSGIGPATMMKAFRAQVKEAVDKKLIRPIEGGQLLINIMSLCVYPFVAKPMIKAVQDLDDDQFDKMIRKRRQEVPEFIIDAIKL